MELQPAKDVSAADHIRAMLPIYASTGHYHSTEGTSKRTLFSNIPASDAECEAAWTRLACFETDGKAVIPSPSVKLKGWEAILMNATAYNIDLTEPLDERSRSTITESADWPNEVTTAMLLSMAGPKRSGELQLEDKICAEAVGQALLKGRSEGQATKKAAFVSSWADLLPEKWRGSATLNLLDGSYRLDNGEIKPLDANAPLAKGAQAPAEAKSTLGAKRKWHDKFRETAKKTA